MSKLHLISKPIDLPQLIACISRYSAAGDYHLLIGNAVTSLLENDCQPMFVAPTLHFLALKADLKCRGILEHIPQQVEVIDDEGMVNLAAKSSQVISW